MKQIPCKECPVLPLCQNRDVILCEKVYPFLSDVQNLTPENHKHLPELKYLQVPDKKNAMVIGFKRVEWEHHENDPL